MQMMRQNDARISINLASQAIGNILRSSFGPFGLDKMIIDEDDNISITNQGYLIIKSLQFEHPAAKLLAQMGIQLEKEMADGTTQVILMAVELIKIASELISQNIPPTLVIQGYKLALKESIGFLSNIMQIKDISKDILIKMAGVSQIQPGQIVEACTTCKNPIVVSCHGKSIAQSELINGYLLEARRGSQQMPTLIQDARIAIINYTLQKQRFNQVYSPNPQDLIAIRKRQLQQIEERLSELLVVGVNVIISSRPMDEMALSYLAKRKCMAIFGVKHKQLQGIADVTKGRIIASEDSIDNEYIGRATRVEEICRGQKQFICIESITAASIIIRGPNELFCDELKRKVKRSIRVVSRLQQSRSVVAGGGACEAALNIYLQDFAQRIPSLMQTVVYEFARGILVIPRSLCLNSNIDTMEALSKLSQAHYLWQRKGDNVKNLKYSGINLSNGKLQNCLQNCILEPLDTKIKIYSYATEAAITLCRIDDIL